MGIIPQHRRAVAGARPLCHRVRKRNDHRRAESGGQGWPVFTGTITAGGSSSAGRATTGRFMMKRLRPLSVTRESSGPTHHWRCAMTALLIEYARVSTCLLYTSDAADE